MQARCKKKEKKQPRQIALPGHDRRGQRLPPGRGRAASRDGPFPYKQEEVCPFFSEKAASFPFPLDFF